jgi:hypothetical protein
MSDTPSQAQGLFGLPSVGDLVSKIPGVAELQTLKTDYDDFAATVDKLNGYVGQYSWIPGASAVAGPLSTLDKGMQFVKTLVNFVP